MVELTGKMYKMQQSCISFVFYVPFLHVLDENNSVLYVDKKYLKIETKLDVSERHECPRSEF